MFSIRRVPLLPAAIPPLSFGRCDNPSHPQLAARIEIVAGDGRSSTAGRELPDALTVRVADSAPSNFAR